MASSVAKPSSHQRQTSQSTSTSSSSVITVQRAASMSSRNGIHATASSLRSHSPNSATILSSNHSTRPHTPDPPRRSGTLYRPDSGHGLREGMGNLNRWSQSTASSKSSVTHRRRSSLSNRLSESLNSFAGFGSSQAVSPHQPIQPPQLLKENVESFSGPASPGKPPQFRKENGEGWSRKSSPTKPPKLPPLVTLSLLSNVVDAAETPSTAATATPTTADLLSGSSSADYFGDPGPGGAAKKPRLAPPQPAATSSFARASPSPKVGASSPVSQSSRPNHWADPARSIYSSRSSSRTSRSERHQQSHRRHSRNRDDPRKGSTGTEGESSASSVRSARAKTPRRKVYSQTIMLSKALQKANHAVLLDNAQNFEGAMDAYADACNLLRRVMTMSATDEDRQKLEDVSNAYSHRISELQNTEILYPIVAGKALPAPPSERLSPNEETSFTTTDDWSEELSRSSTATVRPGSHQLSHAGSQDASKVHPPRHESLHHPPYQTEDRILLASEMAQSLQPSLSTVEDKILEASETAVKQQQRYNTNDISSQTSQNSDSLRYQESVALPLSPRPPSSPVPPVELSSSPPKKPRRDHLAFSSTHLTEQPSSSLQKSLRPSREDDLAYRSHHVRQDTAESTSWLDTIDESGGSSSESVHSRTSSVGLRRKRIIAASGPTAAAFDAAFDAAVEAAYNEGFEPDDEDDDRLLRNMGTRFGERGYMSDARRNVELAKEVVREAEIEAALLRTRSRERQRAQERLTRSDSIDLEYRDDETDEEERMLEEMTRDYIMDDSEYDLQSKSALPRQSDSSGFSGRTWGSSIGSNPATAGTSLSTVAEASLAPSSATQPLSKTLPPPSHPPPLGALPPPPASSIATLGVRERRLSGTPVTQFNLETNTTSTLDDDVAFHDCLPKSATSPAMPTHLPGELPLNGQPKSNVINPSPEPVPHKFARTAFSSSAEASSGDSATSIDAKGGAVATSGLYKVTSMDAEIGQPSSPGRFPAKTLGLRKNFSSSSLKNKNYNNVSNDPIDISPMVSTAIRRKSPPTALSSTSTFNVVNDRQPPDGVSLFDSDFLSSVAPGSPNPGVVNSPLPLEPCPELPLLRPFWFLRCIYQTIADPRGGYISTRLFIPSCIWRVKNVKLKSVDEKVSACDLLSAALSKLAKVDTFDADAVLEEMQFLENVMEQAQSNLSKKLGSEVGVLGTSSLFKGSSATEEGSSPADTFASKGSSTHSKSYLSSWRKLRSKPSGPGVIPNFGSTAPRDGSKDGPILDSLPMTSICDPKFPKRDLGRIQCGGANTNYMAALARLCDAAQVLDQIARQVEDPGLKRSSQTQIGLELSMRHAAEFFGFFVSRFVIVDVSMMLDKYIKRKSEWVLS